MIMPNWAGEGDEFDVSSLCGIEKMTSLKKIDFINFESIQDIELLLEINLEETSEFSGLSKDMIKSLSQKGIKLD